MNKKELIQLLMQVPGSPKVLAWDPDLDAWAEVTGVVYNEHRIRIYTDDDTEDTELVTWSKHYSETEKVEKWKMTYNFQDYPLGKLK